jgi:hypothetical protein
MLDENGQPKRRKVDLYAFDIESLIAAEPDAKQRIYLIVLNNLNQSLVANTETIRSVSSKLDLHLTNFENYSKEKDALLNKGRGMWHVAAWIAAAAQVIGIGLWNSVRDDLANLHETDTKIMASIVDKK